MQYKKAAELSKTFPCTDVPIHCPLCPTAVSGDPPTIWKYNALYRLISEHSSGSTPPSIPGQLLVQMFITKEEEKVLGISEHITVDWRRQNNIPDSDGQEVCKKKVLYTGSNLRVKASRPPPLSPPHTICSSEFPPKAWEISPSGCPLSDI
jgi:hypothetical protein